LLGKGVLAGYRKQDCNKKKILFHRFQGLIFCFKIYCVYLTQ